MVRVVVDSIKVSLISQHRVVVLKEEDGERFLPIWIGPFEADAITIGMQAIEMSRPLTHDLIKDMVGGLNGAISHIYLNDLQEDTFFAQIVIDLNGNRLEIDSRPSDAIAVAVRVNVPIFVSEGVLDQAGILPSQEEEALTEEEKAKLAPFTDLVESLDLDSLGEE
ncbi:MAG: bifunctional nuclease family protein [Anaerolineae bacterium]